MKDPILQHFEFAAIGSVIRLGENASSAAVSRDLTAMLNRKTSIAQAFVALNRMEKKGYLTSRVTEPKPTVGGRRTRVFELAAKGQEAINYTQNIFKLPEDMATPNGPSSL